MGRRGPPRGGFPARPSADGKEILERLAKETGGGFFEVSRKLSIEEIFRRVEEELRNQYNIGYTPDEAATAPGYRKIRLTTKPKGLIVQARDGYYADSTGTEPRP
jgi:VWFA-related protein